MTWMLENPLPAILIGVLTTAILGGGWLQTGKQWLLYLMMAAILLTVGAVLLERMVVTDREQITATLHEIADLVERNQIDAALEYAYSGSPEVRRRAAAELPQYEFHQVSIGRNLEIEVLPERIPPKATAEFTVVVVFSTKDHVVTDSRIARFVVVTFLQEDSGQWRVSDYKHYPPNAAYQVEGARRGSR